MKRALAVSIVLCAAMLPPRAGAAEDAQVELCKFVVDRSAEYIRTGEIEKARRFKTQLETCGPILKDAQRRAVKELIEWSDERLKSHR